MLLLPLTFLLLPSFALSQDTCAEGDDFKDPYGVLNEHNILRKNFATRTVKKQVYGNLPGTKNMFKLNYDCTLESLARAVIGTDCTRNTRFDLKLLGYSSNFFSEVYLEGKDPTDPDTFKLYYEFGVDAWSLADSTSPPLDTDVVYKDEKAEKLANLIVKDPAHNFRIKVFGNVEYTNNFQMIYYRTLAVGCAHKYCSNERKIAVACVYGAVPEIGQPLYFATVTGKKGCTGIATCKKVVPGSSTTCLLGQPPVDEDGNTMDGLCYNKDVHFFVEASTASPTSPTSPTSPNSPTSPASPTSPTAPNSPTSPTSSNQPTSPTSPSSPTPGENVMTDELRNSFLAIHNFRRSSLALGNVRNGAEGNTNCPMASNMYRMVYDTSLETEAQNYANTCPAGDSDVSTRPNSGENTHILDSGTISYMDASVAAMQAWWSEISVQHIDFSQPFSRVSALPVAPTKFTQMAWSATYKVGCGMSRCNSNTQTVVVCRYSPRGNINSQYIYNACDRCACASCWGRCSEGLCNTP